MRRALPLAIALVLAGCLNERVRDDGPDPRAGGPIPAEAEVRVALTNPRAVGRLVYLHQPHDGTPPRVLDAPGAPDDQPLHDYRVQVIKLLRLTDGDVVAPAATLRRPLYDRHGIRTWEEVREPPTSTISPIADRLVLGTADNIDRGLLLLRAVDEPTDWRYLELSRVQIEDAMRTSLVIPDLMTLPLVADNPDRARWWETVERAAQAYRAEQGEGAATP